MSENYMDMKRLMMILMVAALVALPTMAQSFGSKRSVEHDQQAVQSYTTTEPFRSTSAMQSSGSVYSANPTLNEDGTVYNPSEAAYSARSQNGLRKTGSGTPTTPGEGTEGEQPLGDAVLPLMLMALAYMGVRFFRARKRALKG